VGVIRLANSAHIPLEYGFLIRFSKDLHILAITLEKIILGRQLRLLEIVLILLLLVLLILFLIPLLRLFSLLLVRLFLVELTAQHDGKHLVLYALAPKLILLFDSCGPFGILALPGIVLVNGEIELCREQEVCDVVHPICYALDEHLVHVINKRHVTSRDCVVYPFFHGRKPVDVGLQKHHTVVVVVRDKIRPCPLAHFVIEATAKHMLLLKPLDHLLRNLPIVRLRIQLGLAIRLRNGRGRYGGEQRQNKTFHVFFHFLSISFSGL